MSTPAEIEEAVPALPNDKSNTDQQMNKNEDDALVQKIKKIEDKLSSMRTQVINEREQQLEQLTNNRTQSNIHSILDHFGADIDKINKTVSQSEPQQKLSTNESTSEERPELSELDMEILKDSAMKNLQVSYDYLQESHLKFCLVFLSIFPENAVIRKRPLIYWWIGEGLIPTEEKGEEIFEELLKLELITPFGNGKNPSVSKCRIHPWIRYLLISLAKNAELLHFDSRGIPRFDITTSRRACLVRGDENLSRIGVNDYNRRTILSYEDGSKIKYLRTIFNVNKSYVRFRSKWLGDLEKLVVLQLGRWQDISTHHIEVENEAFLKDLRTQKHLKYLSLGGISRITALPNSIVELISLEILDLKACHNLETLPDDISPLKKLTHFDVSECYLLESMPKGVDKLTSLQVLKGFVIGNLNKTPCRIRDLGKLDKLKRLSIHIGSEAVIQEGEFQKLEDLKSVRRLKISWGVVSEKHKEQVEKQSFSFPPSLDKLDFEGLPYKDLPKWLSPSKLKELKKLYIKGGKLTRLNHEMEGTWKVEILRLNHLKNLKYELGNLKNMFPSLRYVQVIKEDETKEWSIDVYLQTNSSLSSTGTLSSRGINQQRRRKRDIFKRGFKAFMQVVPGITAMGAVAAVDPLSNTDNNTDDTANGTEEYQ